MEERINVLEEEARAGPSSLRSSKLLEDNQIIIDEYEYSNSVLKEKLEEMDEVAKIDQETLEKKESEMN